MADYSIDIVANMPAGETTIAQLEALAVELTGAGAQSTKFYQQIQQVSGALDAAKIAAQASATALAEGNAQYRELEKAANVAAKAVEKAALKGTLDPAMARDAHLANEALTSFGGTLKGLESAAQSAAANEAKLASQLQAVKLASTAADKALADQAKAADAAGKAAAAAAAKEAAAVEEAKHEAERLAQAHEALGVKSGKAGRELVGLNKIDKLKEAFSTSSGAATVLAGASIAAAVAIAALTVAVIAGVVALASWAVGLADVNRNAKLTNEAANALIPGLGALSSTFAALSDETGASSADMRAWVKQLNAAKVKAEDMPAALRAVALSSAALGQEGVGEFFDQLKATKGAVGDLAASVSDKLGGLVAKKMRGLDAQSERFKKNIGQLFGDLNIEPVLTGLERLVALFDKNTVAGQAIKFLFESIFQPMIDQADKASTVIEAFALGFLIGLTKVYIALKPAIKAISEFFGFKDTSLSDVLAVATKAGEYAAYVFVGFVAALVAIGGAIVLLLAPLAAMTAAVFGVIASLVAAVIYVDGAFIAAFEAVWTYLSALPAKMVKMGSDLIAGLVSGITNSAGSVIAAVTGAVDGAITAAKKTLGIASPSKVFAEIGGYTGEGFEKGVDDSAPGAQAAMTSMVDPAQAATIAQAAPAKGSSGGPTVHIENLYLAGAKATEEETISLSEALTRLLQGDALALGGGGGPP